MSFRDSFLKKKSTKPTVSIQKRPPRAPKIDPKLLANMVTMEDLQILKQDLLSSLKQNISPVPQSDINAIQSLKKIIEEQSRLIGAQDVKLKNLAPLKDKLWNEINRLKWMNSMTRPDKKGFKKVEMEAFFGSAIVQWSDIDSVVENYKKRGLIRTGRNGWIQLTPKGKEHYRNLLEAND
ncbi:MAG: hypothetical protein ACFFAJ_09310 [Candidatus Hodarchaeota archaeon]